MESIACPLTPPANPNVHPPLTPLRFLNAGISMGDLFQDVKDVDIYDKLMKVNYFQIVWICHYALDYIIASKGRISAVSSGLGKIAIPSRSGYSASKFALQGFIDCLRRELYYTGVKVTLICPGVIKTDIDSRRLGADGKIGTAKATLNGKGNMTADTCARICLDAIQFGEREAYPAFGLEYALVGPLQLFFPNLTDRIGAAIGRKFISNSDN
jgi:short-subunit dehydrogenase